MFWKRSVVPLIFISYPIIQIFFQFCSSFAVMTYLKHSSGFRTTKTYLKGTIKVYGAVISKFFFWSKYIF